MTFCGFAVLHHDRLCQSIAQASAADHVLAATGDAPLGEGRHQMVPKIFDRL